MDYIVKKYAIIVDNGQYQFVSGKSTISTPEECTQTIALFDTLGALNEYVSTNNLIEVSNDTVE